MELVAIYRALQYGQEFVRNSKTVMTRYDLRMRLKAKQETEKILTTDVVLYAEWEIRSTNRLQ